MISPALEIRNNSPSRCGLVGWLERQPAKQKVVPLIPSRAHTQVAGLVSIWGMNKKAKLEFLSHTDVSPHPSSISLTSPVSKSNDKMSLGED